MRDRLQSSCFRNLCARWTLAFCLVAASAAASADAPAFANKEIGFTEKVPDRSGFQRPRPDILAQIKTVGVMPIEAGPIASSIPDAAAAIARLEQALVDKLKAAGFQVIPPAEMRASREAAAATAGNLYDPMTGAADDLKIEQYRQLIWTDYRSRHPVDGYVMSAIVVRSATETEGDSGWDGVKDSTTGQGVLGSLMSSGKRQLAAIPALSLAVWLTDGNQRLQYSGVGGLHLLMYLRGHLGEPPDYVEVAAGPELLSEQRVARALDVILEPIVKSAAQIDADRRKHRNPRYSLTYAPPLGDRAADGTEFISAADFRSKYQTILLMPLQWNSPASKGNAGRNLEMLLQKKLTALGKTVIPPDRVIEALTRQLSQSAAVYDVRTGVPNRSGFDNLKAGVFADIARTTPFDAILYPTIMPRPALFEAGQAHWLGTQQPVSGAATMLEAKLNSPSKMLGTVPALSLQLRLADANNRILYYGSGGIELLTLLRGESFVDRSEWDLLNDADRNGLAIDIAMRRLLQADRRTHD